MMSSFSTSSVISEPVLSQHVPLDESKRAHPDISTKSVSISKLSKVLLAAGLAGAIALMQLQEDLKKQLSSEGNYTEEELEEYLQTHKKMMIDSLWKLNVADIEATLSRVCQMVIVITYQQLDDGWLYTYSFSFTSPLGA